MRGEGLSETAGVSRAGAPRRALAVNAAEQQSQAVQRRATDPMSAPQFGAGRQMSKPLRDPFEAAFQQDFSGVRLHTDSAIPGEYGTSAITYGQDVALGPGQFSPGTVAGDRVLAHEFAHVVQQSHGAAQPQGFDGGNDAYEREAHQAARAVLAGDRVGSLSAVPGPSVQGYCDPDTQTCYETDEDLDTPASPYGVCMDPAFAPAVEPPDLGSAPREFNVTINVSPPPDIAGMASGEWRELALSLPIRPTAEEQLLLYAVPIQYVYRTAEEAVNGQCRSDGGDIPWEPAAAPGPGGGTTPLGPTGGGALTAGTAPTPVEPAAEPTADTHLGAVTPGQTVYTGDGPIELVSATRDYVVTNVMTSFAVGAGATKLVWTDAGLILIDGGMHQRGGSINSALADAIVTRLEQAAGGEPIAELIITHMHADHTTLLPRIYARFQIGLIRVNALQAMLPQGSGNRLDALVRDMGQARIEHVTAEVRRELEAAGGAWDQAPTPEERETQLASAVTAEAAARLGAMTPTRVMLNIPSGGQVVAANLPLGNITIPPGMQPDGTTITQPLMEPGMATILDPTAGAETAHLLATGTLSGSGSMIDAQSSTYVLDLPGGARLLVISDQRTDEIASLRDQLETALTALGRPANLVLLDMTHHLQRGWISRTGVARAPQLARVTRMLSDLAAQSSAGTGALVTSVYGDPQNTSAPNYVDPASRWILESLGFHVTPATGGGSTLTTARDISVLEVAVGEELSVTGVAGSTYMGVSPDDPLLKRAHAHQRLLGANATALRAELATDLTSGERTGIEQNLAATEAESQRIQEAVEAYVRGVERDIGRGIRDQDRSAVAPAEGDPEPAAAEAAALRALLTGAADAVSPDPRFSAAALVVIGEERLASLDPWSRELLAARYQVRDAAGRLRAYSPPEIQQAVVTALERYRRALQAGLEHAPEGSRQILRTEMGRVDRDLATVTGMSQPDLQGIRQAVALAEQVGRNVIEPLVLESPAGLMEPETLRRIEAEHNGLAAINGLLYRVSRSGDGIQVRMLPLNVASVPRAAAERTPGGGGGGGSDARTGAAPPLPVPRSARAPGDRSPIVVPGEVPAGLAQHPNIINISGRPVVLGGRTIAPTSWTPISGVKPGEYVVRGASSAWMVVHPQTGQPIAVAAQGGEWWRVNANGLWTMEVDARGAVRTPGSPARVSRGGPAEVYGGRHPGAAGAGGGGGGGRITARGVGAGGLALLMLVQEIMGPIGNILNMQRYNLKMARAQAQFWAMAGADPEIEMRTGIHDIVKGSPADVEATTSAFGDPIYHTVVRIDVAALGRNLPNVIGSYQDLVLWLDMGKQLNAIRIEPPMPREPTAEDRRARRQIRAIVAGEAGDRRGAYQDITAVVEALEQRTLEQTEAGMRARVAGWTATQRAQIHRLASGAQTPVYATARGRPIRSAAHLLGESPWVRVLDRAEGSYVGGFFGTTPWGDRVKVTPANADAERSALVSAYQVSEDLESVLEEVEGGGREIIDRHEEAGRLESFLAGPMPGTERFGNTRYYRHQQHPQIWTVAIGQLNHFWVDADQLVPVASEDVETYIGGPGTSP